MNLSTMEAFSDELEKIAVSEAWVGKHIGNVLTKHLDRGTGKGSAMLSRKMGRIMGRSARWGAKRGKDLEAGGKHVDSFMKGREAEAEKLFGTRNAERHAMRGAQQAAAGKGDKVRGYLNKRQKRSLDAALNRTAPEAATPITTPGTGASRSSDVRRPGGIPPGKPAVQRAAEAAPAAKPAETKAPTAAPAAAAAPAKSGMGWKVPAGIAGGAVAAGGVGALIHHTRKKEWVND